MPSSTKFMHLEIPVHTSGFRTKGKPAEDVRLQIGFAPGSNSGKITAVYDLQQPVGAHLRGLIRSEDRRAVRENGLISVLVVPMPRAITSSEPKTEWLWNLSVTSRAMAKSRQLFTSTANTRRRFTCSHRRGGAVEAADDG
ncbi:hypothetical protein QJS10_CPB04g00733 [Acorus calamus]|uniref:Uncharacterized protein n=1 Tax=Acorus calamus TaxID=4465 RepID=A0AAV9EXQ5_ACOCL|nr:hypothetical protein QJS10_CPB04g00733 [Acorus calamus]